MSAAMANVLGQQQARALADFRNTLPTPPPLHNKRQHHWVPLATLEAVADACLAEGRAPYIANAGVQHPGAQRATQFQKGVILKLLVRVPLRQRNVRELRLRDHLYKDQEGSWRLSLRGRDLKIGTRQGRVNEYKLNLTEFFPDFIPVLEEFLDVYRPRLPGAAASTFCFLTQYGRPFSVKSLGQELSMAVHMRTGTRWFPHMIRTTWATECLEKTQDFQTAATMLGDTLEVVMKTYYDVVNKDQHAKAAAFLSTALHTG